MSNCIRCKEDLIEGLYYELPDNSIVCPSCGIVGEKLLGDEYGDDLEITEKGRVFLISLLNDYQLEEMN